VPFCALRTALLRAHVHVAGHTTRTHFTRVWLFYTAHTGSRLYTFTVHTPRWIGIVGRLRCTHILRLVGLFESICIHTHTLCTVPPVILHTHTRTGSFRILPATHIHCTTLHTHTHTHTHTHILLFTILHTPHGSTFCISHALDVYICATLFCHTLPHTHTTTILVTLTILVATAHIHVSRFVTLHILRCTHFPFTFGSLRIAVTCTPHAAPAYWFTRSRTALHTRSARSLHGSRCHTHCVLHLCPLGFAAFTRLRSNAPCTTLYYAPHARCTAVLPFTLVSHPFRTLLPTHCCLPHVYCATGSLLLTRCLESILRLHLFGCTHWLPPLTPLLVHRHRLRLPPHVCFLLHVHTGYAHTTHRTVTWLRTHTPPHTLRTVLHALPRSRFGCSSPLFTHAYICTLPHFHHVGSLRFTLVYTLPRHHGSRSHCIKSHGTPFPFVIGRDR